MNLVTPKAPALSMRFCSTNRPLDIEFNVQGIFSLPRQIIQLEQAYILTKIQISWLWMSLAGEL
jgi:hypothetical protein